MTRATTGLRTSPTVDPFQRETSTMFNGRHVEPDTELTVRDHDGRSIRVRFRHVRTNPRTGDQSIEVVAGSGRLRSFGLEQVERVHRITKTRQP